MQIYATRMLTQYNISISQYSLPHLPHSGQVYEYLGFEKTRNAARVRSLGRRSAPALELFGDEDQNYERRDQHIKRLAREEELANTEVVAEAQQPKSAKRKRTRKATNLKASMHSFGGANAKPSGTSSRKKRKKPNPAPTTMPDGGNDVTSKNFTVNSFKLAGGPMIDLNVLVEEVDAGRFPSMKRYEEDDHVDECEICHETSGDGDKGPVYCCAFCSNAEHFSCLKSRYNVFDWDEDDDFMCHSCLATCLHRRHRAERRRLGQIEDRKSKRKRDSPAKVDSIVFDHGALAPMDVADGGGTFASSNGGVDQCSNLEMPSLPVAASETSRQSDIDLGDMLHQTPGSACPDGGPGGLVCCSQCATSYSQILSNTTKAMETQAAAKIGQEVSELMEMLQDAQTRMRLAVDVSKENNISRRAI